MKLISKLGLKDSIKLLLPGLMQAAIIAKLIQAQTKSDSSHLTQKDLGNAFSNALTDADLVIQSFLAVQVASTFGDASFFGEEGDKDHISSYIPKDRPYLITVDPIDGTLYFKHGLSCFDIILSIFHEGKMVASVVYQPHEDRALIAIHKQRAYKLSRLKIIGKQGWPRLYPPIMGSRIIMVDPNLPEGLKRQMIELGFEPLSYTDSLDKAIAQRDIFEGKVCGFVRHADPERKQPVQAIDVGALALLVKESGGKCIAYPIRAQEDYGYYKIAAFHGSVIKAHAKQIDKLFDTFSAR